MRFIAYCKIWCYLFSIITAYVIREGRVVALKVNNDREDVDRCVSQWRNVFRVVEDPECKSYSSFPREFNSSTTEGV